MILTLFSIPLAELQVKPAFMYQLMVRMYGTNNFPDCSNLCHESSGVGMAETVGIGKGTVQLEDFEEAEAIFVFGQNPGTNHPRMLAELQQASRNGCKIVTFNPLKEAGLLNSCTRRISVRCYRIAKPESALTITSLELVVTWQQCAV